MIKLKDLALSMVKTTVSIGLLAFGATSLNATTTQIAEISAASTDNSASNSVFQLSITSEQMPNALSTASHIELSIAIDPEESHVGRKASVYTVIVASGKFFKLNEDESYVPWDGSLEDLTPFVTNQTLASTNRFTVLDGSIGEAGSYLYFVAYGVEGESRLLFTPDPAQLEIATSESLPDNSSSQAAATFEAELESAVVQAKCILCHVEGGLARSSALQFQRTNTASALNNFDSISTFVKDKGAELFLAKITGGEGHAGGMQLNQDSEGYASFERVVSAIIELDQATYYTFRGAVDWATTRQASFLTEVTLESRDATLRRATLLMQGRLPTQKERDSVVSDASLRAALRNLMQGPAFREFVVTSVNDRLLTAGAQETVNIALENFLVLHNKKSEEFRELVNTQIANEVVNTLKRTSGELVAHVIEKELPYSEILTADYMMMNPLLNKWLEGTAVFASDEGNDIFKPSAIEGYYYSPALREVESHENFNSIYEPIAGAVANFPHAGILTDMGFLGRYPTTATNRNRARARWTFYHFLGIDIEKSSQRPTDEASLSDRNNPTLNNPSCTVCHALLDPVAGAFQNWGEFNFYRRSGYDSLDGHYKYPPDGSPSPYRPGDLWYRDMRAPGLFDKEITERDATLRELAELIVAEPSFRTASASFWWSPVFGKPLLDKPTVEADNGYAEKLAAYRAQQDAIEGFSRTLSRQMNAKDMIVDMFMSPWFSGEEVTSYAFDRAHYESKFGSDQLLTPQQLARKTHALTGVGWRASVRPGGIVDSDYEELSVLLGGIDSEAVTSRATELTPTMASILMTHATETACVAVARQFAEPKDVRSLLSLVDESTQPQIDAFSRLTLPSKAEDDRHTLRVDANLTSGVRNVTLTFNNPECNWNGSSCDEQRILYISSVSIIAPSGKTTTYRGDDPRLYTIPNSWMNGGQQNCNQHGNGQGLCYGGAVSFQLNAAEPGVHRIEAVMSAQLMPSTPDLLELTFSVISTENILASKTENALLIKRQIIALYDKLHGVSYTLDSDEVTQVYEIFASALVNDQNADGSDWDFEDCDTMKDGYYEWDLLSVEQIESYKSVPLGGDWYENDWSIKYSLLRRFTEDPIGTKYAWTAVMMYMLSHYDYLHE